MFVTYRQVIHKSRLSRILQLPSILRNVPKKEKSIDENIIFDVFESYFKILSTPTIQQLVNYSWEPDSQKAQSIIKMMEYNTKFLLSNCFPNNLNVIVLPEQQPFRKFSHTFFTTTKNIHIKIIIINEKNVPRQTRNS